MNKLNLWLRWVAVNAFGEMFGLGLTLGLGGIIITSLESQGGIAAILIAFVVAVTSGAIEATIVGLAQWWAMHPWFPVIRRKDWWLATLAGALLAYVMGYLPSTLMSLGEQSSPASTPVHEPGQWVILLLPAGLGLAGGAVLSFAQWLTMRRKVHGSSIWIPANMLAWLFGMPLIFLGIDIAQRQASMLLVVLIMAGVLLLAGLVVGVIHGAFLVKLAGENAPGRI